MAVKLVGEFWANVQTHEDLIKKCFIYLFQKYPDPEGEKSSWNLLMVRLNELNILSSTRFNPARGDAAKSEDKKWEQYLYKWIEHFLGEAYEKTGKHTKRFVRVENIDAISSSTYGESMSNISCDDLYRESSIEGGVLVKQKKRKDKTGISKIPMWASKDCFPTEPKNPLDNMEFKDLLKNVKGALKNDRERQVFEAMHAGCVQAEVADMVGCTPAAVSAILKRIRSRCSTKGILPRVYE